MRSGMVIATVRGIRVRAHASWILVAALIVISLASIGVPGSVALPESLSWLLGVIVAAGFFGSVVVHELAHALMARRRGVDVSEVTLLIFGGTATFEKDVPDARSEAAVALAGPIVSLLLAGGLLAIAFGGGGLTGNLTDELTLLATGAAWWLGMSNLMLGGLNLVPGFPMDGGRVLRAIAWGITGDFLRATRLATFAGRGFAYALIAAGLVVALANEVILGIWLAFIGWFLNQAAESAYRRVEFGMALEGMAVRDVMEHDVAVVGPNLTLDTFVEQHLMSGKANMYPVTMDGLLVGTVELAQVRGVPRADWPVTRVTDVMRRGEKLTTLTEPLALMDAIARLEESGATALPVVSEDDQRKLLGLLSRDGLARALRNRASLRQRDGRR
jgi:Zn-dependent protease